MTTGMTVFKSRSKNYKDHLGIAKLENFSSVRGIPVFKDHSYELVSEYNNPHRQKY